MEIEAIYWRNQCIRAMLGEIKIENISALLFQASQLKFDDVLDESSRLYEEMKKKGVVYENDKN